MIRNDKNHHSIFAADPTGASTVPHLPKQPYQTAVSKLAELVGNPIEVEYNEFGDVRHLVAQDPTQGLFNGNYKGDARAYARQFLAQKTTHNALGLRYVTLVDGATDVFAFGTRVEFKQVAKVKGVKDALPVRAGFVHVFVDNNGHIINVTSTIRRGTRPPRLGKLVGEDKAVESARTRFVEEAVQAARDFVARQFKKQNLTDAAELSKAQDKAAAEAKTAAEGCSSVKVELVLSSHEDGHGKLRMDPTYVVTITTCEPRDVKEILVDGKTGHAVHSDRKLHYSQVSKSQAAVNQVKVRCFLDVPDPNVKLDKQVHDHVIDALPDPTTLSNKRFDMKIRVGGKWVPVKAKADGTFNYNVGDKEFSAVVTFVALNTQLELFESWGLKPQDRPIPVFMDDPSVSDNAYFDPEAYEIHMGVGSGAPSGLTRWIAFDLMVEWHEDGHHIVYLMTPGKDLPGAEGGAMHESTGDTVALLMRYWFQLKFGKALGHTLTVQDIKGDRRVIGPYSLPPDGIRIQRNDKKTPQDKTGEVHDDGLISGGATCDLIEALVSKYDPDIEKALVTMGKLQVAALALVPAHKVTFKDMLRAFITADQTLNGGAHRQLIEKAFGDHGIKLGSQGSTTVPVIIVPSQPRRRRPRRRVA